MQAYIGTKIIQAERMSAAKFHHDVRPLPNGDDLTLDGYKVVYPDAYVSWSPKATFEEAYRLVSADEVRLIASAPHAERPGIDSFEQAHSPRPGCV